MDFLEEQIGQNFDSVVIETSIPASDFYKNRGFKFTKSEEVCLDDDSGFSYDLPELDLSDCR